MQPLAQMRRFLAPPEQAAALAAVRNVRVAEEDLARVAGEKRKVEAETRKAEQAATVGLAWPQPKRRRGPPSRQRRFEAAICQAIDNGEGIGDINSADVSSWWKPGDLLTKKEEEVVADALASCSGSLVVDDNDDKDEDDDQGDVAKGKKRKYHWAPLKVKRVDVRAH